MKKIISSSEIVGTIETDLGGLEVCATGEAVYDEAASQLIMRLDSNLRRMGIHADDTSATKEWLPAGETIREHLDLEEALPAAKEIFHGLGDESQALRSNQ